MIEITDLRRLNQQDDKVQQSQGMAKVFAKANYLNTLHYVASNGRWDIANAHVWRLRWMYKGDSGCFQDKPGLCGEHLRNNPYRVCHTMFRDIREYHRARRAGFSHSDAMELQDCVGNTL